MVVHECKMCGGRLSIKEGQHIAVCEFCGTSQTISQISDDARAMAFTRGNQYRRLGDFDKAVEEYERILHDENSDAEAHWCCALSRFGIEYVKDPMSEEYVPTCHRASFDSFLEDADYLEALKYSDGASREQYENEAEKINEVLKKVLSASQNEEAFDVFISYKESDENGNRTKDSVMAQEVYEELKAHGLKVFFSRITLEDKAGNEYEPIIFAAIHSAKVMIVIGTKKEYFDAVWVKNEWSRYLTLMKKDGKRKIIPCYHGMDPYDLPKQLAPLQSYDMSKVSFIQSLESNIDKALGRGKKQDSNFDVGSANISTGSRNGGDVAPLLRRMFMFIEDGDFTNASNYTEKILDLNPECAAAYVGKLMIKLNVRKEIDLSLQESSFYDDTLFQKAIKYADASYRETLNGYIKAIYYRIAHQMMESADDEKSWKDASEAFSKRILTSYKDAPELAERCRAEADKAAKESAYRTASTLLISPQSKCDIDEAIELLKGLGNYNDAAELLEIALAEYDIKVTECEKNQQYSKGTEKFSLGVATDKVDMINVAKSIFLSCGDWKNSRQMAEKCDNAINNIALNKKILQLESEKKKIVLPETPFFTLIFGIIVVIASTGIAMFPSFLESEDILMILGIVMSLATICAIIFWFSVTGSIILTVICTGITVVLILPAGIISFIYSLVKILTIRKRKKAISEYNTQIHKCKSQLVKL